MPVNGLRLSSELKGKIAADLAAFLLDEFEIELSRFRSGMVVDFVAQRVSAGVYNNAVLDARAFLSERLEDMEATLFAREPERK